MKSMNAVRTEIHYAQVGEYQLPLLTLPQTDDSEPLSKSGRMRLAYLKTQRPVLYNKMLLNGTLWPHLQDVQKNGLQVAGTHDDHSVRQVPRAGTKSAHSFSGWRT